MHWDLTIYSWRFLTLLWSSKYVWAVFTSTCRTSESQTGVAKKYSAKSLPRNMVYTTDVGTRHIPHFSFYFLCSLSCISCNTTQLWKTNTLFISVTYPAVISRPQKTSFFFIPQFLTNMQSLGTDIIQKGKRSWSRQRGVFAGKSTASEWRGGVFPQCNNFDRDGVLWSLSGIWKAV